MRDIGKMFVCLRIAMVMGSAPVHALVPAKQTLQLDIAFEHMATALPAGQRTRISDAVDRIRTEDWCPFEVVIVVGLASRAEGGHQVRQRLANRRAVYVSSLLKSYGLPAERVYAEAKPDWNVSAKSLGHSNVEIEFVGGLSIPGCPYPRVMDGLRLITDEWVRERLSR